MDQKVCLHKYCFSLLNGVAVRTCRGAYPVILILDNRFKFGWWNAESLVTKLSFAITSPCTTSTNRAFAGYLCQEGSSWGHAAEMLKPLGLGPLNPEKQLLEVTCLGCILADGRVPCLITTHYASPSTHEPHFGSL